MRPMGGGPLGEKPLRVYIPRPLLPKLGAGELEVPRLSLGVGFRGRAERRSTNIPRKISFTRRSRRALTACLTLSYYDGPQLAFTPGASSD